MKVWRIQTITNKRNISEYCLKNNIAAMDWSIDNKFDIITDFETYDFLAKAQFKNYNSVKRMAKAVKENDLIWMRCDGIYYISRVTKETHWEHVNDEEAVSRCARNQLKNLKWIKVGDESDVPGAITTSFICGHTFQQIHKQGVSEFSKCIYDKHSKDAFKYNQSIDFSQKSFFSLISPSDCEDLLSMWLYSEKYKGKYVCIPSTNKTGTQKYEFVSLDSETGEHIYCQVKNGDIDLNADQYAELAKSGKVYLFTSNGRIKNKVQNVYSVQPKTLYDFACNEKNRNIIPPNIEFWMQFAAEFKDSKQTKGIMIDTNGEECEKYMFENRVIAAWGKPGRYIQSFNKNDYAMFYSKGIGVISIGKIEEEAIKIENGFQCSVEFIIEPAYDKNHNPVGISPNLIKESLGKSFYFASTRKVPFLSENEVLIIKKLLEESQNAY